MNSFYRREGRSGQCQVGHIILLNCALTANMTPRAVVIENSSRNFRGRRKAERVAVAASVTAATKKNVLIIAALSENNVASV